MRPNTACSRPCPIFSCRDVMLPEFSLTGAMTSSRLSPLLRQMRGCMPIIVVAKNSGMNNDRKIVTLIDCMAVMP